jgi:hypothetical protein
LSVFQNEEIRNGGEKGKKKTRLMDERFANDRELET